MNLTHLRPRLMHLGLLLALPLAASTVRIIQTNSAGDDVSIIDPATNKVVGVINGIEVNHGAAVAPDGSHYYISNEAESTLDVVDTKTLKVTRSIKLSGHPNNIGIGKQWMSSTQFPWRGSRPSL
jgi:YVTN family beta-propeller protein